MTMKRILCVGAFVLAVFGGAALADDDALSSLEAEYVLTGEPLDFSGLVETGDTLTVSGLPKGLTWNKTANARTGVAANTVTGSPTTPGTNTVTFTLTRDRVKHVATTQFIAYGVYVTVDWGSTDSAVTGTVTGSGYYTLGTAVKLTATAGKDSVFSGWYGETGGDALATDKDYRTAANTFTLTADLFGGALADDADFSICANFVSKTTDASLLEIDVEDEYDAEDWMDEDGYVEIPVDVVGYSLPKVTVTGLPKGLSYNATTGVIAGKPTVPGVYTVTVKATNTGHPAGVTAAFELKVPNLADENVPVDDEYVLTGDPIDFSWLLEDGDALAVSGLPKGLSWNKTANARTGVEANTVTGRPTTPGKTTVTFTLTRDRVKYVSTSTFIAYGVKVTAEASSDDGYGAGTVKGEGYYAVGATVKLTATPDKTSVFAGWYDVSTGDPLATTADYRTASNGVVLSADDYDVSDGDAELDVEGRFVSKETDAGLLAIDAEEAYDGEAYIDADGYLEIPLEVESYSVPKVTVTGLPKGVSYNAAAGALAGKPTVPGVYTVTVKATNTGNTKGVSATFELTIPNLHNEKVPVDDEYVLTGEPLDFSDLLAAGGTLAVSGLPKGLTWNKTANTRTGVAANTVTGMPTAPCTNTVTFTLTLNRQTYVSTATFIATAEEVAAAAEIDLDTGDELYVEGEVEWPIIVESRLTPKVTVTGLPTGLKFDAATLEITGKSTVPGVYTATVKATNANNATGVTKTLTITVPNLDSGFFVLALDHENAYSLVVGDGEATAALPGLTAGDLKLASTPTYTVSGLPTGVSFKNGVWSGTPTKAGVYTVKLTSKYGGVTYVDTFTVEVVSYVDGFVGNYTGYSTDPNGFAGVWTVSVASSGKVSAKLNGYRGTGSFSGTLLPLEASYAELTLTGAVGTIKGCSLVLSFSCSGDGDVTGAAELSGTVGDDDLSDTCSLFARGTVASENLKALAGTWTVYYDAADDGTLATVEALEGTDGLPTLAVKVTARGAVTVSGTLDGAKVSASVTLASAPGEMTGAEEAPVFAAYFKAGTQSYVMYLEFTVGDAVTACGFLEEIQ